MVACRMKETVNLHEPVLLLEVLEQLAIKADGIYIDATFGRGGHSKAILHQLGPKGRLLVMDKDPEAIAFAHQYFNDPRFTSFHGSFAHIEKFAKAENVYGKVDGILLDLGVSSPQLDDAERGFSFQKEGKLDMRMNSSAGISAATWLATVPEQELARVLWEYGEERHSRRIARAIVSAREEYPILTTTQLAKIIAKAHPSWQKGKNPATQCFQAIRIEINHELLDLEEGLKQSLEVLKKEGRLLAISFHSLEDRLVKHFIQENEKGEHFPARLPIKQNLIHSRVKRLGRPIKASALEIARNPRARSATLRIAEKIQ